MTKKKRQFLKTSGSPHALNHLPLLMSPVSSGLYVIPVGAEIGFMMDFFPV